MKKITGSMLCADCNNLMTEFVEVKGIDHLTNKTFYEDRPFCSYCFDKDAEKVRLKVGIYKTKKRDNNHGIHK